MSDPHKIEAMVQGVIDEITVSALDCHEQMNLTIACMNKLNAEVETLKKTTATDINALVMARRERLKAERAEARLASVPKVKAKK